MFDILYTILHKYLQYFDYTHIINSTCYLRIGVEFSASGVLLVPKMSEFWIFELGASLWRVLWRLLQKEQIKVCG